MAKTPIGDYIVGTTFESLSGALPIKRVYENDQVIAFWHPKPFWEQHVLIVPKKKIKNIVSLQYSDMVFVSGSPTGKPVAPPLLQVTLNQRDSA